MQLSQIDLNLFTVFDAIHREGGITPASRSLHLSQPAVSHALSRLRELMNDPLFERQGNAMVPTPLARALVPTVRQALAGLAQMVQTLGQFDPATSRRAFTIALRAAQEGSLLPPLLARFAHEAPHVEIATVRIERRDLTDELATGELDLALDVELPLSAEVRREAIRSEPLVVLARAGHPRMQEALDLEGYLAEEHVLVTGRRRGRGYEDLALARLGRARRVRVRCQLHSAACTLVARSELLVTMPGGQLAMLPQGAALEQRAFPVEVPPLGTAMYWHANVDEDPANRWLRACVAAVMRAQRD
ncbi:MAG: LysR family transcriptional regulator [Polyangiales bacterium]